MPKVLSNYGKVENLELIPRKSGTPRFAFVTFEEALLLPLLRVVFLGKEAKMVLAQPKNDAEPKAPSVSRTGISSDFMSGVQIAEACSSARSSGSSGSSASRVSVGYGSGRGSAAADAERARRKLLRMPTPHSICC